MRYIGYLQIYHMHRLIHYPLSSAAQATRSKMNNNDINERVNAKGLNIINIKIRRHIQYYIPLLFNTYMPAYHLKMKKKRNKESRAVCLCPFAHLRTFQFSIDRYGSIDRPLNTIKCDGNLQKIATILLQIQINCREKNVFYVL